MTNAQRDEMLIRMDERIAWLPDLKTKVDAIHGIKTSVRWLTWGVRGLYGAVIGAAAYMALAAK